MSGLRNTEPTAGALPPGRNTRAVAGNIENRWALAAVWSWKVLSTTNPRLAMSWAGASRLRRDIVPNLEAARSHVAGDPGTPTDRPELTALVKLIGEPSGSRKAFSVNVAGAVSRPSIVWTLPVAAL